MKNDSKEYRGITTLAELRSRREKLRWQIATAEDALGRDWRGVQQAFSFANIVRTAFSKLENIQALISGVREGYSSIAGLFRKEKD